MSLNITRNIQCSIHKTIKINKNFIIKNNKNIT